MTDEVSVVRSFSAKWGNLDEHPASKLPITPTLHLRLEIEGEEFFMLAEDADELADFILKTSPETFRVGMLG